MVRIALAPRTSRLWSDSLDAWSCCGSTNEGFRWRKIDISRGQTTQLCTFAKIHGCGNHDPLLRSVSHTGLGSFLGVIGWLHLNKMKEGETQMSVPFCTYNRLWKRKFWSHTEGIFLLLRKMIGRKKNLKNPVGETFFFFRMFQIYIAEIWNIVRSCNSTKKSLARHIVCWQKLPCCSSLYWRYRLTDKLSKLWNWKIIIHFHVSWKWLITVFHQSIAHSFA